MKKLILLSIILILGYGFAQDELILLNGTSVKGKYVSTENDIIYFIPEDGIGKQSIHKDTVRKLILSQESSISDKSNNYRERCSYSEPKDPFKAGMLSAIIPSGGHFYNEEYDKGINYLISVPCFYLAGLFITLNNIDNDDAVGVFAGGLVQFSALSIYFYSIYDAIISSNNINKAYYDKYLENQQKEEASK